MLLFESQARGFDTDAGIFHTGHPCPDEKRPASLRAALRVFDCLRECGATHSNSSGKVVEIATSPARPLQERREPRPRDAQKQQRRSYPLKRRAVAG